ncbi:hypothetical protein PgNI_10980 [Pyricularia grisea]|uniref:Uncharacterized protein n=1 Tax=Pyricularia grisea TaxID=148305 RepID=A0A6P8AY67_PYRGI|nr:hypothetical protein PgNI_10980 [Pyricularia grisea]TLD07234.1 hypothetical protein PgNI_10980 [Pyricularia grisea]
MRCFARQGTKFGLGRRILCIETEKAELNHALFFLLELSPFYCLQRVSKHSMPTSDLISAQ